MLKTSIPFEETYHFSDIICDYLREDKSILSFYNRFPSIENFEDQIKEKSSSFSKETREILFQQLKKQYGNLPISSQTESNLELLKKETTFTVVTGHQLSLFTGPLYFWYKIISAINLCKKLKQKYDEFNFVPIYWMATEDHDFAEINHFNFQGKKLHWNRKSSGAVGHLGLDGLKEVSSALSDQFNGNDNSEYLEQLFSKAYLEHDNLTEATRYLVNEIFGEDGLVIVDGDDKELKRLFVPQILEELKSNFSEKFVIKTNKELESLPKNYKIQVNPRDINLFYIRDTYRDRIIKVGEAYSAIDSQWSWNLEELLEEVQQHPERFSPNVILRPLYQEVILPNLCYIGGGGELAYWLQLKEMFASQVVPFPILLLRNSALLISEKETEKLKKLDVGIDELFLPTSDFKTRLTKKYSELDIDFSPQKDFLKSQFEGLYKLAEKTDKSFLGAVAAQEKKQLNGLSYLEKRLLKAQKRKLSEKIDKALEIKSSLFPNGGLQERVSNFSEFYQEYGSMFKKKLMENLDPLHQEFLIIEF